MSRQLEAFFDPDTFTLTYVVFDPNTKDAVVIDPVLDYCPAASKIATRSVEKVANFMREKDLHLHVILETHAHADHVSGAQELKKRFPACRIGVGKNMTKVQELFAGIYHFKDFPSDGRQFDVLLEENAPLDVGSFEVRTLFTPGHTPACASYLIDDMAFTGDALFMPDFGTGRCDFPAGSAEDLYTSVHDKLYQLPDDTRVFPGHDYQPGGRQLRFESSIGEQKAQNIQLKENTSREEFVRFRTDRDSTLKAPRLLLPSIQINIAAGKLPSPESNGQRYLKIPLS